MTPEIEALRATVERRQSDLEDARKAEHSAMNELNNALIAWASDELSKRGITVGETPVYFSYAEGRFASPLAVVSGITARYGKVQYRGCRLTKGGKVSNGSNADLGWFPFVQAATP